MQYLGLTSSYARRGICYAAILYCLGPFLAPRPAYDCVAPVPAVTFHANPWPEAGEPFGNCTGWRSERLYDCLIPDSCFRGGEGEVTAAAADNCAVSVWRWTATEPLDCEPVVVRTWTLPTPPRYAPGTYWAHPARLIPADFTGSATEG